MKLFSQSPRWCHLTTTLWSLIVLESGRNVDINGVSQFLEVIHWRAHGKITEEEFSILYSEWMMLTDTSTSAPSNNHGVSSSSNKTINNTANNSSSPSKKKTGMTSNVPVTALRSIILEKNYAESDLDLFIGMIIHEANLRLINTTISFVNKKANQNKLNHLLSNSSTTSGVPTFSLEVVNQRWIALCEELFFSLDTPGYGVWKFDEAMFFCACLSMGLQSWKNEFELEADLAMSTLSAMTLQFMRETGANVLVSSSNARSSVHWEQTAGNKSIGLDMIGGRGGPNGSGKQSLRGVHPAKQEITLVMLKRYFVRKNIGESELAALVQHVKFCAERLVKLVKANGAEEFYFACQPIEHRGSIIGSPRLWQESILISSGFVHQIINPSANLPPILLFLLTDSEKYLSGTFRAIEVLVDDNGFIDALPNAPYQTPMTSTKLLTNPLFSASAANDELHENAYRLVIQFRKWNQEGSNLAAVSTANYNPLRPLSTGSGTLNVNVNELRRDPIYQLIVTALIQYKTLQQLLNAALFDFCVNQYGPCPSETDCNAQQLTSLTVLCANLTPNGRDLLVELGLEEAKDQNIGALSYDPSAIGDENTVPTAAEFNDNVSLASSMMGSKKYTFAEESSLRSAPHNRIAAASSVNLEEDEEEEEEEEGMVEDLLANNETQNRSGTSGSNKISDLAVAGRRKSTLIQLDQQQRQAIQENKQQTLTTGSAPTTVNKSNGVPNYFKPTATYLAKSSKGKVMETVINPESDASANCVSSLKPHAAKKSMSRDPALPQPPQPRWENVLDARPQDKPIQLKTVSNPPLPPNTQTTVAAENSTAQGVVPKHAVLQHNNGVLQPPRYPSPSTEDDETHEDGIQEISASERSSAAPPSSIEELLQQGHSPGKYAQMLREILRKMSKDDSHVRLKSLEQVMQLGQDLVEESEEKRKKSPLLTGSMLSSSVFSNNSNNLRKSDYLDNSRINSNGELTFSRASSNGNKPFTASQISATPLYSQQHSKPAPMTASFSINNTSNSNTKTISRTANVPGLMPDHVVKKSKKAFGHPVNG